MRVVILKGSDLLPARVNQHVALVRTDKKKADPFFVLSAINSDRHKKQLLALAQGGATREALTKSTIQVQDSSETWHRLTFRFYDATAKPWFSTVWQRMATALSTAHQQANSKEPDWVKWKTWDWCEPKYRTLETAI